MLYLNGQPLPITYFPDNTSQVWKLPETVLSGSFCMVRWHFSHESEIMYLAQLKHLLDEHSVEAYLTIQYLPYARQDKEVSNTTTFALRTFARILNAMNFKMVTIVDPHSETALKLINESIAIYPMDELHSVIQSTQTSLICYPDKGAVTKYVSAYDEIWIPYIYGDKVRDQLTGNIISYKLNGDPKNKNVLIVDDICDGGATFRFLAKDLLAAGANNVVLFVTHGIFSKGLQILKDSGIQRIFSQDGEASEEAGQIIYRRL